MSRIVRKNNTFRFSPANPFLGGAPLGTTYQETLQVEEAIVVDVVTNDAHPDYDTDGYNVGAVQFRFIGSAAFRADIGLNWAFPLEANVTDYPLLNEVVLVTPALNRFYYSRKLNTTNRVTAHALFGLNDSLKASQTSGQSAAEMGRIDDGGAPIKKNPKAETDRLGEKFVDKETVLRLRAQEGDIIYEGRSGHSIRFGSSFEDGQSPTVLIRCGPNPTAKKSVDSEFALIDEDIDLDLSSIWMVANKTVPLTFATVEAETHFRSMDEKPTTLDGNQIIVNTDRLVINTKGKKLLVSTFLGTHFTTLQDHTVDTEKNYKSFALVNREVQTGEKYLITVGTDYLLKVGGDKTSTINGKTVHDTVGTHAIRAKKFFLGTLSDESQPLVLGEELRELLLQFVNAHLDNAASHTLPTIGIGPLAPGTIVALKAVQAKLASAKRAPFESQKAFIAKRGAFEPGKETLIK
ncbi:hypothetical protein LCGC14_0766400 [marine sediment metagenome]|uniref:Uncharacterized protein n=1 Tax=marine sediment metagenome TaxID=412755 RepID=A0A0F9SJP5_9ZZZZ